MNREFSKFTLIKLLKTFTRKEINDFDKFVRSPFFNNQSTLIRLFNELKLYYPEFDSPEISKKSLFKKINPGLEYNDALFRKYFSNLNKLAEDFLSYIENENTPQRRKLNLLYQFDKRNLNELYHRILTDMNKNNNKKNFISNDYFYDMHSIEEVKFIHHIRVNEQEKVLPDMMNSHQSLILQLLLVTTVYNNIFLVNKKVFREKEENSYFEKFLDAFDFDGFLKSSDNMTEGKKLFAELCRYDLLLSKDCLNAEYLNKMKNIVFKMSEYFNDNLLYTFLSHLNIYYFINVNSGYSEYEKNLFKNYKYMIEKGLYNTDGQKFINYSELRSILQIALNLKEFDWAENFIKEYGNCYSEDDRCEYYNYSMALLKFEEKKHEESLEYLSKTIPTDLFMKLDVNVLIALIYYELNYADSAKSLAVSFRHYINSNETLSDEVKSGHLNFLKFYNSLLKLRLNKPVKNELEKFKNEITSNFSVRRIKWLIEKTDELSERINKK